MSPWGDRPPEFTRSAWYCFSYSFYNAKKWTGLATGGWVCPRKCVPCVYSLHGEGVAVDMKWFNFVVRRMSRKRAMQRNKVELEAAPMLCASCVLSPASRG